MKSIGKTERNLLNLPFFLAATLLVMLISITTSSWAQTLGNYPNKTIMAGLNTTVVPAAAPVGASSIVAYTHTNFSGQLTVNPTTGVVYVTNAKQAGTYTVTVKAFGAGTVTKNFTLTVTNPLCSQGNLGDSSMITASLPGVHNPLAIADLNNDGKQDWVNIVGRVKLGDGKGGFTDGPGFGRPDGSSFNAITIGDLNGDGRQDAVGYYFFNNFPAQPAIFIRLGDGTGGFTTAPDLPMPAEINAISLGDFNADGRLDLAAGGDAGLVYIRIGDGTGGFTGSTQVAVSGSTNAIVIGDFNKDGKQDWVTSAGSVRLGDGNGGFSGSTELAIANSWSGLAMADFNGDGNQDLAFGNTNTSVPIRLGDGNGGFTTAADVPVTFANAGYALAGDFNGDGKTDLAVSSIGASSPKSIAIKLGNGAGGFTDGITLTSAFSGFQRMLAMGDFNGDGRHDLAAVGTGQIALYFGQKPMLVKGNNQLIADGDNTPAPADFTDFGTVNPGATFSRSFTITNNRTDNLLISSITSSNARFVVSGAPTMVAPGSTAAFMVRFSPNAAGSQNAVITINNNDICGETVFDFTVTSKTSGFNYTNTTITAGLNTSITPTGFPIDAVKAVAIAGSSFTGLLIAEPDGGLLRITNAKQAGVYNVTTHPFDENGEVLAPSTFTLTVTNPLCSQGNLGDSTMIAPSGALGVHNPLSIADLNNDGKQDWVTISGTVKLGDGKGGFTDGPGFGFPAGSSFNAITIGDLNGDGRQDVVGYYVSNASAQPAIFTRLGEGNGGFTEVPELTIPGQLNAISLGDFNADGKLDLAAGDAVTGLVYIRLGNGSGGFTGSTQVTVSGPTQAIAIGDFNKDGKLDWVTSAGSVRLGDGLGGFSGSIELAIANSWSGLAMADFNGDGNQDLAFGNTNTSVPIRLGDGNGGFTAAADVPVTFANAGYALAGDYNGDGKTDLAVSSIGASSPKSIAIKLGNGAGGFTDGVILTSALSGFQRMLAMGDFNGDGRHDLAAVGTGQIALYFGLKPMLVKGNNQIIADGDNTPSLADFTDFGTVNPGATFSRSFTITNNRTDDLLIGSITSSNARFVVSGAPTMVAPGSTAGFLVRFSPNAAGSQNAVITINNNDICGETVYNFTVTGKTSGFNYSNTTITSGLNTSISPTGFPANAVSAVAITGTSFTGSLTLAPYGGLLRITNAKHAGIYSVTVQPYTSNGDILAPSTFSLTVTNPLCSQGQFSSSPDVGVGAYARSIAVGDFNGDGKQDFATANPQAQNVYIRLGDGLGGFTGNTQIAITTYPAAIVIGEFNGDGNQDFATANYVSNNVSIRLGDGLGGFTGNTQIDVGTNPNAIAIGDFNDDGKLDIATANYTSNDVSILMGDGSGGFTVGPTVAVGTNPYSIAIGDFNEDGKKDFATCNSGTNNVSILLGNGLGSFTVGTNVPVGTNPYSIAIGDFNGDGKQDFATSNYLANSVSIRLGDGLGGFTGSADVGVGNQPWMVAIGDFDGDGKQDIATTNYDNENVSIRLGDGIGGFIGNTQVALGSYSYPMGLTIGDFNGDSNQDLAIANNSGNIISIRLGGKPTINTWLGTISSDWNNASNWSLGMVPNTCTATEVKAGTPNTPLVKGDISIPGITISAGGTVNVQPGARLNITGKTPPP